jgi:hypothetical protein
VQTFKQAALPVNPAPRNLGRCERFDFGLHCFESWLFLRRSVIILGRGNAGQQQRQAPNKCTFSHGNFSYLVDEASLLRDAKLAD